MRALPLIVLLSLAGCSAGEGENGTAAAPSNQAAPAEGSSDQTLAAVLATEPRFIALVRAAGMTPVLEGREPYTILAPTGAALDALPPGTLERLQQPAARPELTALLRRHILPGTIARADLERALQGGGASVQLASMAGDPLTVSRDGEAVRIGDGASGGARLVGEEARARNGIVHRIDTVLPAPALPSGSEAD